jgi:hypothetical protein
MKENNWRDRINHRSQNFKTFMCCQNIKKTCIILFPFLLVARVQNITMWSKLVDNCKLTPGQIWDASDRKKASERIAGPGGYIEGAEDRVIEGKEKIKTVIDTLDCSIVPRPPVRSILNLQITSAKQVDNAICIVHYLLFRLEQNLFAVFKNFCITCCNCFIDTASITR